METATSIPDLPVIENSSGMSEKPSEMRDSSPVDATVNKKRSWRSKFTDSIRRMGNNDYSASEPSPKRRMPRPKNSILAQAEDLSEKDVIIAVMGPTGAGKSSFIQTASGFKIGIGHQLESCTTDVSPVKVLCAEGNIPDIVFVDTPGFDDTHKTDIEILEMIAEWLKKTYERDITLAGILYLHRISDNRMAGTPLKNLRMFKKLCGDNALKNVILTTTMWDEVDEEIGEEREQELKREYWSGMIKRGSTTARFQNTSDSAWSIADPLIQNAYRQRALKLQEELVDMKRQLRETDAGQQLYGTLESLFLRRQETLRKIQDEMKRRGNSDPQILAALEEEREELGKQLEKTITDMQALKLPLGKRLLRMLRHWG